MTIRDDARQEAERRYPGWIDQDRHKAGYHGFIAGAVWASEQADQEEDQGPAASCHLCVGAGGYEDYDGSWTECSCQRADREPSDAEAALSDECDKADSEMRKWVRVPVKYVRALLAAQEVRRG